MDMRARKQMAPPLSCGCHFHVFGPFGKHPMSAGRTYTPPEALVPRYLRLAETIGIQRMPFTVVAPNVQALVAAAPDHCVWGTDWPHSQMNPPPEAGVLPDQFFGCVPDAATRQTILVDNPARLYGF
jgi:predicted TIM-barrel fold metal-dependent hydrolase